MLVVYVRDSIIHPFFFNNFSVTIFFIFVIVVKLSDFGFLSFENTLILICFEKNLIILNSCGFRFLVLSQ